MASGYTQQASYAIAIGSNAGWGYQRLNTIAFGENAGNGVQGSYAIAIGSQAGQNSQGTGSIAIGSVSGQGTQSSGCIAIGFQAGKTSQEVYSIAIGYQAGQNQQKMSSIAIGYQSGSNTQIGQSSISIGNLLTNSKSNTIAISSNINASSATSFYTGPIRKDVYTNANDLTNCRLEYNSNFEITASSTKTFIINHPLNKNKYLVHSCLEGPEVGVYYHGKNEITNNNSVNVYLPNYVGTMAHDFTIHITHIYDGTNVIYNASKVINNSFVVFGENGKFFWIVYGKRYNIVIEPIKTEVVLKGSGPYKWI